MRILLTVLLFLCAAPLVSTLDDKSSSSSSSSIAVDGSTLAIPRILTPPEQEAVDTNLLMAAMAGSQERFSEALTEGANPNALDSMGRNSLTLAAINGKTPLVKDILQNGRCTVDPSLVHQIDERITIALEDGDNELVAQLGQVKLAYKLYDSATRQSIY